MIVIEIDKDHGKMIIKADGHAGFAPAGQDIVCAGVTAILETAALGLKAIADAYPEFVKVEERGE